MSAILEAIENHEQGAPSIGSTLLDLVMQVNECTDSAEETTERVLRALDDGAVHLTGNFRDCPLVV